jgi:alginate O-acetyltransferase complex protein AlgI
VLFNSFEYLLFFVAALVLCWALVGMPKLRIWVLLLASYYFYISNNHWLIVLIILSTQIDYIAGLRIASASRPSHFTVQAPSAPSTPSAPSSD